MPDGAFPLEGVIRDYAWGSPTAIPRMLGIEPDGRPAAELWFGAHAGSPSPAWGSTLDAVIAADPDTMLGTATRERFGDHLPYLLKVLAADKALSIQVHPDRAQAEAGFAAEQRDGLPSDRRNYTDANHKPELLCALTPFEAMCGFRPVDQTLAVLGELAVPELDFVVDALRGPDGLRTAFTAVLEHDDPATLAGAVAAHASSDGPLRSTWIAAHDFPDDIGVVVTLLLNYRRLEPGQAIYLAAGNVHGYLRGTGVEIMANSDNVLRCGLTAKRIDVGELVQITDFTELTEPLWPAEGDTFRVPVPDFALRRLDGDPVDLAPGSPRIVLCVDGMTEVGDLALSPGHAAYLTPTAAVNVRGGNAFVAMPGQ
jgi:mannose-6-phosphate isomerase